MPGGQAGAFASSRLWHLHRRRSARRVL